MLLTGLIRLAIVKLDGLACFRVNMINSVLFSEKVSFCLSPQHKIEFVAACRLSLRLNRFLSVLEMAMSSANP
jgi:hypothetical protein